PLRLGLPRLTPLPTEVVFRDPLLDPFPLKGLNRFAGREDGSLDVGLLEPPEDLLPPRTNEYLARPAPVCGLVATGPVHPHLAGLIDVSPPNAAHLARPHPGEALEFDHRPDLRAQEGKDSIDVLGRYGLNCGSILGCRPALFEPLDCLESLVGCRWYQFLGDRPLEHALDPPDSLVDEPPRQFRVHPTLTDSF